MTLEPHQAPDRRTEFDAAEKDEQPDETRCLVLKRLYTKNLVYVIRLREKREV
jgi:hypothetical protein